MTFKFDAKLVESSMKTAKKSKAVAPTVDTDKVFADLEKSAKRSQKAMRASANRVDCPSYLSELAGTVNAFSIQFAENDVIYHVVATFGEATNTLPSQVVVRYQIGGENIERSFELKPWMNLSNWKIGRINPAYPTEKEERNGVRQFIGILEQGAGEYTVFTAKGKTVTKKAKNSWEGIKRAIYHQHLTLWYKNQPEKKE